MRPPSPRAPNPDYVPPAQYLKAGYFLKDGRTIRPDLLGKRAAAMGRELLMAAVPLETMERVARELQALLAREADYDARRRGLLALMQAPGLRRFPLLVRLLQVGTSMATGNAEVAALARHLLRVYQLAAFERVLSRMTAFEADVRRLRDARKRAVRGFNRPKA
ncbi:MAG: hypothetical protein VKP62_08355 [Candidatus Sericytochromatia bacterium]|nr:hypothetical protein [Candidatus Sericytochromatia bacterium]